MSAPAIDASRRLNAVVRNDVGEQQDKCSVYLAPSSVSDSNNRPAGFGIFTTKPLPRGSYIFPRGTGPSIVIPDIKVNQRPGASANESAKKVRDKAKNNKKRDGKKKPDKPSWAQSVFLPACAGFEVETDDPDHYKKRKKFDRCMKATVNVGSLTNFHPFLVNVLFDDSDVYRDDMLNRYEDPGAGAFSYHMGERWYTTRDLQAGEELFNEYGEDWFFNKELGKEGKHVPRRMHYLRAAREVRRFLDRLADEGKDEASIQQHDLDELLESIYQSDRLVHRVLTHNSQNVTDFVDMLAEARSNAESTKFPTYTFEYDDNTDEIDTQYALSVARRTTFNRTTEWIERNGRCLDNIIPGRSSIPQAGQGAFASRDLKAGSIVAPVPTMLQITDRSTLHVYRHEQYKGKDGEMEIRSVGTEPVTSQLLLNYCFGHDQSSLLLCPATNANLINHCSTRGTLNTVGDAGGAAQCDPKMGPNAELRWATEFDPETSEWLELSLEEIDARVSQGRRGLSFEVVATRDIRQGQEIFIDYGKEWEEAWAEHVARWQPPPRDSDGAGGSLFVPVSTMNANKTAYLRTEDEEKHDPYPHPQVHVACFVSGFYHPCAVLRRAETTEPDPDMTDMYPLPRLGIERRRPMYHVRVYNMDGIGQADEYGYWWRFPDDRKYVDMALSDRHIRFFHGRYSSDQHLRGTFRKNVGVPEGMWPERWKDLIGAGKQTEDDGAKANAL